MLQTFYAAPVASVILLLIALTSVLSLMNPAVIEKLLLYPYAIVRQRKYYLLFTHGFVHADIGHLLFNVISLYSIGFLLEATIGPERFAAVYIGSLVLGAIPSTIKNRDNPAYKALGASGAISGLFFCGMLYYPWERIYMFFIPIGIPWFIFSFLFLAVSWYGAKKSQSHIGHDVHLYGALTGLFLGMLLDPSALVIFAHSILRVKG
jgi:membrane associated rhomboid family serine protease